MITHLLTPRPAILPHVVRSMNTTAHSSLPNRKSPAQIVFGRQSRLFQHQSDEVDLELGGWDEIAVANVNEGETEQAGSEGGQAEEEEDDHEQAGMDEEVNGDEEAWDRDMNGDRGHGDHETADETAEESRGEFG